MSEKSEQDLSGVWTGEYWYSADHGRTSFAAHLTETAGALDGTTLEPASYVPAGELSAVITGARNESAVKFRKVYDASAKLRLAPISYSGVADGALEVIQGRWRLVDRGQTLTGGFIMRRIGANKAAAKRKAKRSLKAPANRKKELVTVETVTPRRKPAKTK